MFDLLDETQNGDIVVEFDTLAQHRLCTALGTSAEMHYWPREGGWSIITRDPEELEQIRQACQVAREDVYTEFGLDTSLMEEVINTRYTEIEGRLSDEWEQATRQRIPLVGYEEEGVLVEFWKKHSGWAYHILRPGDFDNLVPGREVTGFASAADAQRDAIDAFEAEQQGRPHDRHDGL